MKPLPPEAARLLADTRAPARLVAHLTLVHDVAATVIVRLDVTWLGLAFDRAIVRLGAALHDIGKLVHPEELTRPGHAHEATGAALLRQRGFPDAVARGARTHARWAEERDPALQDLLVALADSLWRGRRDDALETAICANIAQRTGQEPWVTFAALDEIAVAIAAGADARLAWQNARAE